MQIDMNDLTQAAILARIFASNPIATREEFVADAANYGITETYALNRLNIMSRVYAEMQDRKAVDPTKEGVKGGPVDRCHHLWWSRNSWTRDEYIDAAVAAGIDRGTARCHYHAIQLTMDTFEPKPIGPFTVKIVAWMVRDPAAGWADFFATLEEAKAAAVERIETGVAGGDQIISRMF